MQDGWNKPDTELIHILVSNKEEISQKKKKSIQLTSPGNNLPKYWKAHDKPISKRYQISKIKAQRIKYLKISDLLSKLLVVNLYRE